MQPGGPNVVGGIVQTGYAISGLRFIEVSMVRPGVAFAGLVLPLR